MNEGPLGAEDLTDEDVGMVLLAGLIDADTAQEALARTAWPGEWTDARARSAAVVRAARGVVL